MSDIALQNAAAYAARYQLRLAERLGFGIHGTVHVVEYESKEDRSAMSVQSSLRKFGVNGRLKNENNLPPAGT